MRIDSIAEALDDRHHAWAEIRLLDRRRHQVADGLPGEAGEVTAQGAHLEEQWPEHLGDGENPLGVADVLLDVIDQEGAELGATLGGAGGAQTALLTGEGDQHLVATGVAADAGEAVVPDSTAEVAGDRLVPEAGARRFCPAPRSRSVPGKSRSWC